MPFRLSHALSLLLFSLVLTESTSLSSTDFTWNLDADGDWNTAAPTNWTPNTGFPDADTDRALFDSVITAARSVTINGTGIQVQTINFNNANQYTILSAAAGSLEFISNSGNPQVNAISGSHLIDVGATSYIFPSTLDINTQIAPAPAGTVRFGSINLSGGSVIFNIAPAAAISMKMDNASGSITNGTFVKAGTGLLELSTSVGDQVSADMTINSGTVRCTKNNNFASTVNLTLASPGILDLNNFNQTFASLSGTGGSILLGTGGGSTLTIDTAVNTTYAGTIDQTGALVKQSGGELTLAGNNTYTGSTTIGGGSLSISSVNNLGGTATSTIFFPNPGTATLHITQTLTSLHPVNIAGTGTINVDASQTATFSGSMTSPAGAIRLIKTGLGTLSLPISNPAFAADALLSQGTISFGNPFGLGFPTSTVFVTTATYHFPTSFTFQKPTSISGELTVLVDPSVVVTWASGAFPSSGGGVIKDGAGTLIFSGGTHTFGDVTIQDGVVSVDTEADIGAFVGSIIFAGSGGTFNVTGTGDFTRPVILNAPATFDITGATVGFLSSITGTGPLVKTGAGTMVLSGLSSYTESTTISSGIFRAGANNVFSPDSDFIVNATLDLNSFNETIQQLSGSGAVTLNGGTLTVNFDTDTSTFAGTITGPGSLVKQGTGTLDLTGVSSIDSTTVTAGTLSINNSFTTTNGMSVSPSATLTGVGPINATGEILISGTLSPGNGIGNMTINAPVRQAAGSTLLVELAPATAGDLSAVAGSYTIMPGATLMLSPTPGVYPTPYSKTIVQTSGGVFGTFDTVISTFPTFIPDVQYTANSIILVQFIAGPFFDFVQGANAKAAAFCFDTIPKTAGSDAELVDADLRTIINIDELSQNFNSMQPSQYTALALAQENATLYAYDALLTRFDQNVKSCQIEQPQEKKMYETPRAQRKREEAERTRKKRTVWASPLAAHNQQDKLLDQPGYHDNVYGGVSGFDYAFTPEALFGGALGYSHIDLTWKEEMGTGHMNNGYGLLYAGLAKPKYFLLGSAIAGYNHYETTRRIPLTGVSGGDREAKGNHSGWQASLHLKTGLRFAVKQALFTPFVAGDYLYFYENPFKERDANSLNLQVKKKSSDLLIVEGGLGVSRCIADGHIVIPYINVSGLKEWRFLGNHEKASFAGSSCVFKVEGMNPNRILFSGTAGINFLVPTPNSILTFEYKALVGSHFTSQRLLAQYLIRF